MSSQHGHTSGGSDGSVRLSFRGDSSKWTEFRLKFRAIADHKGHIAILDEPKPESQNSTWLKANRWVFSELTLQTTGDALLLIAPHDGDGHCAWEALEEKFSSKSQDRAYDLFGRLFSNAMGHGTDPDRFILQLEETATNLRLMGESVGENLLKAAVLGGLSEEYTTVAVVIRSQASTSMADVKAMVRRHYVTLQKEQHEGSPLPGTHVAMYTKSPAVTCFHCKKQGHIRKHCPALGLTATTKTCKLHGTGHADAECRVQQQQQNVAMTTQHAFATRSAQATVADQYIIRVQEGLQQRLRRGLLRPVLRLRA
jgi:gag-polypeptide of LTR copia-type